LSFVKPLPSRPLDVELCVPDDALLVSHVAIPKSVVDAPLFHSQMADMRFFFIDPVNLDRNGSSNKDSTIETLEKHVRRFIGFAKAVLKRPVDVRSMANGTSIAQARRNPSLPPSLPTPFRLPSPFPSPPIFSTSSF
jgi:hypothetical protein